MPYPIFTLVLALADTEAGPGCTTLDFNNWCPDSAGSADTDNTLGLTIGSCTGRPYSTTHTNLVSATQVAPNNIEALYFLFGGSCTGSTISIVATVSEP